MVQGLVVPCVPSPEVCDGVDNNCDGLIDNNPVDVGIRPDCQVGNATVPPNPTPLYWNVGSCKPGKLSCVTRTKVCGGEVTPGTEVCNGADDNCNGQIDENVPLNTMPPAQTLCPGMLAGTCNANVQCIGGTAQCVATQGPTVEICNGVDDDCDGLIDETEADDPSSPMIDVGGACGFSSVGICELGVYVCSNGVRTCVGDTGPQANRPL
ncbi:MAG: MopE-related protein [Polyangiaceae bacterium]